MPPTCSINGSGLEGGLDTPLDPSGREGVGKGFATADILDQLSRRLAHLIHSNQHNDPAISRYFSPVLEAKWQLLPTTHDLPTFLSICNALTSTNSEKVLGILNSCALANLEDGKRRATTWVTLTAANIPDTDQMNLHQETVVKMDWQLGRKGWVCVRQTSLRAPGFVDMF